MAFSASFFGIPTYPSLAKDDQPPCDVSQPSLLNMTFENSPQDHNAEIISDCDVLSDRIGQGGNFAIRCSPAPDPVLFTSYGRCSLSFQYATKNNNEDNAT